MTEYQLKIIFVIVLCAPILYFGVKFFMSLVNSAIAGKKIPKRRGAKNGNGNAPGDRRGEGNAPGDRRGEGNAPGDRRGEGNAPDGRKRQGRPEERR